MNERSFNNKYFVYLIVLLLIFGLIMDSDACTKNVLINSVETSNPGYNTIYVPDNVSSISQALNLVIRGGTIFIKQGIYNEPIEITKPVRVIGIGKTIIMNKVLIMNTHDVKILNLTILINPPGSETALIIHNSSKINISNIFFLYSGIIISKSRNIVISDCIFKEINFPAIIINNNSTGITIKNNIFNYTYTALAIFYGNNVSFHYNKIYNSLSYSVKLYSKARNNKIFLNDFYNNAKCFDNGKNNIWYDPVHKLGNYWENLVPSYNNSSKNKTCGFKVRIYGLANSYDKYPLCNSYEEYLYLIENENNNAFNSPITGISEGIPFFWKIIIGIIVFIFLILISYNYYRRKTKK